MSVSSTWVNEVCVWLMVDCEVDVVMANACGIGINNGSSGNPFTVDR